jgi:23S rRNA (adenine-N6)-dimethyltransferase
VAGRARRARRTRRELSQNFLRSRRLAADIVRCLDVRADELVVEIGAGDGRLTAELARRARHVVAIELDPHWAARLRSRFDVVEGDALTVQLPVRSFRVVGNIPFDRTTAILHRLLDDPMSPLTRADLIVQWEVACKRSAVVPSNQLGAQRGPWWEFAAIRHFDAGVFVPRPSVDAALLRITRRGHALVAPSEASAYRALVERAFARGLRSAVPPLVLKRAAAVLGFAPGAEARDLDVHQWTGLYAAVRRGG